MDLFVEKQEGSFEHPALLHFLYCSDMCKDLLAKRVNKGLQPAELHIPQSENRKMTSSQVHKPNFAASVFVMIEEGKKETKGCCPDKGKP